MAGSAATDRGKEALGMMALHETLRNLCINSDWTYSVFWTIRPRPRLRGGNGCKVGDDNGSLMLMWEDGFCRGRVEEMDGCEDQVKKSFSKMSIQLYNYGEGWVSSLMGKVASDKCHKWVFKEPSESEQNISNYWQSSFDAIPPEWTEQFESGIQTIAVIQAGHGLLQLGSCKIIPEDLHFVLRMRHTFESLGYQSGFYLSQLFASTRGNISSPSATTIPLKQPAIPSRTPPLYNWAAQRQMPSPNFHNPAQLGYPSKDETHMFLLPHSSEPQMENMMGPDHVQNDIKWPNGLSFFSALTGRSDDTKLLFNSEGLGNKPEGWNPSPEMKNPNDFLSLDNTNSDQNVGKVDHNKYKRSFTLPARMATSSSSSSSLDQHRKHNPNGEFRNPEASMYSDVMDTFLE
ncbi:putative transcription factor MYC/MYB, protein RICE SALT SENSITIVE 3 [Helianthus annuus]|nr:putative transcription factor MYC/MYB, protein RICE SALT SENSITIVE 3 [Helianthus annuus]